MVSSLRRRRRSGTSQAIVTGNLLSKRIAPEARMGQERETGRQETGDRRQATGDEERVIAGRRVSAAYEQTRAAIRSAAELPELMLSSEHFFDDIVFQRFMEGTALPYPGGHAALVEFPNHAFPARVAHRFFDLRRRRVRPVLAHPE